MRILKFIYRGFMTGMPLITYNPLSNVNFHAPFTVNPESLYINYRLTQSQYEIVNDYVKSRNPYFSMEPIRIAGYDKPEYYLSLNIYNCSSPLFLNEQGMTRFEINTYVTDGIRKGTLIMDYMSNALSMDPVNVFKDAVPIFYNNGSIVGKVDNIYLNSTILFSVKDPRFYPADDLSYYSDIIYYSNGIYDKLYYDSTLTNAILKIPKIISLNFTYLNTTFSKPESIFYFQNQIDFVGSVWENLFKLNKQYREREL